jgi:hypothetical protein
MLALMHQADPYGHLLVYGNAPTDEQLAVLTGAPPTQIPALLVELEKAGVFSRTRTGTIYSRRMTREERARKDGARTAREGELPTSRRGRQHVGKTEEKRPPPGVVEGVADPPPSPQKLDTRSQRVSNETQRALEREFDDWHSGYPRKEDRGHALKAFLAARKRGVALADLVGGCARYAEKCRREGTERKFIRLPATWLNGEGWLDEPGEPLEVAQPITDDQRQAHRMKMWHEKGIWLEGWGVRPSSRDAA